jgi:hypothetical protein
VVGCGFEGARCPTLERLNRQFSGATEGAEPFHRRLNIRRTATVLRNVKTIGGGAKCGGGQGPERQGDGSHHWDYVTRMHPPPDQPPPSTPVKPKLTPEERRARQADRLTTIRLRMLIGRELEDRGVTTPAAIGEVLGMPAREATSLLTRHQWREGDVALLQAAAARLGVQMPG